MNQTAAVSTVVLALVSACASGSKTSAGGPAFIALPISENQYQIKYIATSLPSHQRALTALCRCADFALARGYPYLRISDPQRLGPGVARWRLDLMHSPPPAAKVLDVAQPSWQEHPSAEDVVDAVSFAAACLK